MNNMVGSNQPAFAFMSNMSSNVAFTGDVFWPCSCRTSRQTTIRCVASHTHLRKSSKDCKCVAASRHRCNNDQSLCANSQCHVVMWYSSTHCMTVIAAGVRLGWRKLCVMKAKRPLSLRTRLGVASLPLRATLTHIQARVQACIANGSNRFHAVAQAFHPLAGHAT